MTVFSWLRLSRSAYSSSPVAVLDVKHLVKLFSHLNIKGIIKKNISDDILFSHLPCAASQAEGLRLLNMWARVWVALEWEGSEGRHVLRVAGHQEQFAGTLGPAHQAGVQTQLSPLVITGGPVTASCRLNINI